MIARPIDPSKKILKRPIINDVKFKRSEGKDLEKSKTVAIQSEKENFLQF